MADTYVVTGANAVTKNGTPIANVLGLQLLYKSVAATSVASAYVEAQLVVRVQDTTSTNIMTGLVANVDTTAKNAYTAEIAKNYPYDTIKSQSGDTITWSAGNITATAITVAGEFLE